MPAWKWSDPPLTPDELAARCAPSAHKLGWFFQRGYGQRYDRASGKKVIHGPHLHQIAFHTMRNPDTQLMCQTRSLVAGRRGGKTMGVGWDMAYYMEHPEMFHLDFHGYEDDRPLHGWVISSTSVVGRAARLVLRGIIHTAHLPWQENRSDQFFELKNGGLLEMKTAVNPQDLRGMGLDFIWWDEAAFVKDREALDVSTPALDDMEGIVCNSTTPDGKNWWYDEYFSADSQEDPDQGTVEYRTIDNPHFPISRWKRRKRTYHPMLFKQEYEASFDAMVGKELPGHWLTDHFFTMGRREVTGEYDVPRVAGTEKLDLEMFLGVDPAASLSEKADHFAMVLGGLHRPTGNVFLLKTHKSRELFADQLDLVDSWHQEYRPVLIGAGSQAYEDVLRQQLVRRPTVPPIVPMLGTAERSKAKRILAMSPLFKVGKVRIRETMHDFIEEWLNYDTSLSNPDDDLLDACEMMLRVAGVLLAVDVDPEVSDLTQPASNADELAKRHIAELVGARKDPQYDPELGTDW